MSEDNNAPEVQEPTELEVLKNRAKQLGIPVKGNISVDTLRERIDAVLKKDTGATQEEAPLTEPTVKSAKALAAEKRSTQYKKMNKLVRVEITCMNPDKRAWQGEIFTCGNSQLGTMKKFVPFGVPYHVPQLLLNMIEERKCSSFVTATGRTGNKTKERRNIKEFNVRYLGNISPHELGEIRDRQLAQGM